MSGKELWESLLKRDWGGSGVEQCHSSVDSCLYRARIKLFTSVKPSAYAKSGQLILLQCFKRNFAVSPNHTCVRLLPYRTQSCVGSQAAGPCPLPAGKVQLLGGCDRAGSC